MHAYYIVLAFLTSSMLFYAISIIYLAINIYSFNPINSNFIVFENKSNF